MSEAFQASFCTEPACCGPTIWDLPDELWERIEPIVSRHYPPAPTGQPRADLRRVLPLRRVFG